MDPITRASKQFLTEADIFWRSGRGCILPIVAGASERDDLVKTLRLAERSPENRRPLFLHEEPFAEPRTYFVGLADAIRSDYELIRQGASEEGVSLAPFGELPRAEGETLGWVGEAVLAIERVAARLGDRLDGVLLALVPVQVAHAARWRESITMLTRVRFTPHVRIAVFDPPGGPLRGVLGDAGAHFRVDPEELIAFLKQLGSGTSKGSTQGMPPAPSEEQRRAFEVATGRTLPAPAVAAMLRTLLLDATRETSAGQHSSAAEILGQARELCRADRLVVEEAMVLIALSGASLAAGAPEIAIDGYHQAAALAQTKEAWSIVCQAWLGAGGAYLNTKQPEPAATAYRMAAESAQRGRIVLLRIESLRMAGTCLLMSGRRQEAIMAWGEALDAGARLDVSARDASTLRGVAIALVVLLKQLGLAEQAAHVQTLYEANGSDERSVQDVPAAPEPMESHVLRTPEPADTTAPLDHFIAGGALPFEEPADTTAPLGDFTLGAALPFEEPRDMTALLGDFIVGAALPFEEPPDLTAPLDDCLASAALPFAEPADMTAPLEDFAVGAALPFEPEASLSTERGDKPPPRRRT